MRFFLWYILLALSLGITTCWTPILAGMEEPGSLVIRMIGPDGASLPSTYPLMVSDLNHVPVTRTIPVRSELSIQGLPEKPLLFSVWLEVPGFGKMYFAAANGGKGFVPNGQTLDAAYEVARHRVLSVSEVLSAAMGQGYRFPESIANDLHKAWSLVLKAAQTPGTPEQGKFALESLALSGPAGERTVVENGRQKLDRQGGMRPSQWISTFSYYMDREGDKWIQGMDPVFNAAAANWHWQEVMQPDGKGGWTFHWGAEDSIQHLHKMGKHIRAVTGMWMNRVPPWHPLVTFENVLPIQAAFAEEIAQHFPEITNFQVASEMNGSWDLLTRLGPDPTAELVRAVSLATAQARPDAARAVNTNLPYGEDAASHFGVNPPILSGFEFYRLLEQKQVPYEAIVLQLYHEQRDLFEIDQRLEQFRRFGKKVQIELAAFSSNEIGAPGCHHFPKGHLRQTLGCWHRPWDETLQADWLERMFIITMSKDFVEEFCWWDLADYEDCYFPWGGLLDSEYHPKEAYHRLRGIVERWRGGATGFGG